MELHLGNNASLVVNPLGESLGEVKTRPVVEKKAIEALQEGDFVRITGTVMHIFEPRFFDACPTCNKKGEASSGQFLCQQHGPVEPKLNCIVNLYFDDGTENIRVVCFSEQAETLLKRDKMQMRELKNNPERFNDVKNNILGLQLEISGKVTKNEMFNRLEFRASSLKESDPKELAKEIA